MQAPCDLLLFNKIHFSNKGLPLRRKCEERARGIQQIFKPTLLILHHKAMSLQKIYNF